MPNSHRFDPDNRDKLLNEERRKRLQPEKLLTDSGLAAGMKVVDVGAGNGFFSLPAAGIVGQEGKVYAVDVEQSMLSAITGRAAKAGLKDVIIPVNSQEHCAELPGKADLMIFSFVIHEVAEKKIFLDNYLKYLQQGGAIIVLEWQKKKTEQGPPVEHRIQCGSLINLLEKEGIKIVKIETIEGGNYMIMGEI